MTLFKKDRKPPYMESEEIDLNPDKVEFAVQNMSYVGLQAFAAYGLLMLGKIKSPAEICRDLETLEVKDENNGSHTLFGIS